NWQFRQERFAKLRAKADWREDYSPYAVWNHVAHELYVNAPELWNGALHARHWQLLRWMDEPVRSQEAGGTLKVNRACCLPRERAGIIETAQAHAGGGATEADIIEQLIGDRATDTFYSRRSFHDLGSLSKRKRHAHYDRFQFLFPIMERCRKRVLEVELTRGDNPTAASGPALSLSSVGGVANLIAILRTLGRRNFVRGWSRDNQSMETVLSHLVRCCFPLAGETAADFIQQAKAANITEDRLVELAV